MGRRKGRLAGFLLVTAGVVALALIGFGTAGRSTNPGGSPGLKPQREPGFRFCKARARRLPGGFTLADRALRNLGGNVIGESTIYRDGGFRVEVHVGYDALEAAEDLDFDARGTTVRAGRELELLQSAGLPRLRAAYARLSGLLPPCDELTVFTTGMTERELVAVAARVRVTDGD